MTHDLCRRLSSFVGSTVNQLLRVVVTIEKQELELRDTLLIYSEEMGVLQLLTDGYQPSAKELGALDDFEILGEYSDRSEEFVRAIAEEWLPITVQSAYAVWDLDHEHGFRSLVGVLLVEGGEVKLGIVVHLDDILVRSPSDFWEYVGAILPQTRRLEVVPISSELSAPSYSGLLAGKVKEK